MLTVIYADCHLSSVSFCRVSLCCHLDYWLKSPWIVRQGYHLSQIALVSWEFGKFDTCRVFSKSWSKLKTTLTTMMVCFDWCQDYDLFFLCTDALTNKAGPSYSFQSSLIFQRVAGALSFRLQTVHDKLDYAKRKARRKHSSLFACNFTKDKL